MHALICFFLLVKVQCDCRQLSYFKTSCVMLSAFSAQSGAKRMNETLKTRFATYKKFNFFSKRIQLSTDNCFNAVNYLETIQFDSDLLRSEILKSRFKILYFKRIWQLNFDQKISKSLQNSKSYYLQSSNFLHYFSQKKSKIIDLIISTIAKLLRAVEQVGCI